eukprot:scaffold1001_cov334-Prasinococcus_capsulatus_cf.AAC.9
MASSRWWGCGIPRQLQEVTTGMRERERERAAVKLYNLHDVALTLEGGGERKCAPREGETGHALTRSCDAEQRCAHARREEPRACVRRRDGVVRRGDALGGAAPQERACHALAARLLQRAPASVARRPGPRTRALASRGVR